MVSDKFYEKLQPHSFYRFFHNRSSFELTTLPRIGLKVLTSFARRKTAELLLIELTSFPISNNSAFSKNILNAGKCK